MTHSQQASPGTQRMSASTQHSSLITHHLPLPPYPDLMGISPLCGRYVAETLMPALLDLEEAYQRIASQERFQQELQELLQHYAGRPTLCSMPGG